MAGYDNASGALAADDPMGGDGLSYLGNAVRQSLKEKHLCNYKSSWNITHGKIVGDVAQTPPDNQWGKEAPVPREEHSDSFVKRMEAVIVRAQDWLDITSLSPPDQKFLKMFKASIEIVAKNAAVSGKTVVIRLLFGNIIGMPVDCHALLNSLCPPKGSNVNLWVGAWRKGLSWNHSKIIAVDGKYLFTGGHNIWDDHYLKVNPVHDISVGAEGQVAHDGHVFANAMWDFIIQYDKTHFVMKLSPDWLDLSPQQRVTLDHWPRSISKHPPMYVPDAQPLLLAEAAKLGDVPIITCGRYGTLHPDIHTANSSDSAIVAMLSASKRCIKMSLQDLGPLLVPVPGDIKMPIPGGVWPEEYLSALGLAIYERGVDVEIVLSNPNAVPGKLSPLVANYGNGWSCAEVASEIVKAIQKHEPHIKQDRLRKLVSDHLRVTFLKNKKGCPLWPDGDEIGNHAKFFMVDDMAYYIGSQNLYIANLAEWGVIVDSATEAQKVLHSYWMHMWSESYTPDDCHLSEVMDSLGIEKNGCDVDKASDELKALALKAQRRAAKCPSAVADVNEVMRVGGHSMDTVSRWCTDLYQWKHIKRGEDIPANAIQAGTTKSDGVVHVARFGGLAGKINQDKGKMWNFWAHDTGIFFHAAAKLEADILLALDAAVVEWKPIKRGEPIPANAVQAGVTKADGFTYVGRFGGESGKINKAGADMWNFWGHNSGEKHEAEILLISRTPGSTEAPAEWRKALMKDPVFWIPIKRGEDIPPTAVSAGVTDKDGVVHIGRFGGEAGKINQDGGKFWNFWGHECQRKEEAQILIVLDPSLVKWLPIKHGEPIPPDALRAGMTKKDGFVYIGRLAGDAGKINATDGCMENYWADGSGQSTEAEILVITGSAARL